MRNKITALILCLLSYSMVHAQPQTDRERDGLKDLVQTVKVRPVPRQPPLPELQLEEAPLTRSSL